MRFFGLLFGGPLTFDFAWEVEKMDFSLQRANPWKRMSAFLLDGILLSILAVGIGTLLSLILGYETQTARMQEAFGRYETEYGVTFNITQEEYEAYSAEKKEIYDAAYAALIQDGEAVGLYQKVVNLMLLIVTFSLLAAFLILEFAVPLWMGYGRTVGKRIFGLALTTQEGVKIRNVALLVRTLLGKFTIETMIPAYVITMIFFNMVGLFGTMLLFILAVCQLILYFTSQNRMVLHDRMAGTVVVDFASQQIFETREDMLAARKKAAAEKAARREW